MVPTAYAASNGYYFGDVNNDQSVDNADAQQMRYALTNGDFAVAEEICDINGDGVIDAADALALQAMIAAWHSVKIEMKKEGLTSFREAFFVP